MRLECTSSPPCRVRILPRSSIGHNRPQEAVRMAFRQGLALGAAVGALATLLYTPLEGRDARAILLGPFGWREVEDQPDVAWSPRSAADDAAPTPGGPTVAS